MTTEFEVIVRYWNHGVPASYDKGYDERKYVVRAGDARIAATKGLKLFSKASSYTGPLYRSLTLRDGQVLVVTVTR